MTYILENTEKMQQTPRPEWICKHQQTMFNTIILQQHH